MTFVPLNPSGSEQDWGALGWRTITGVEEEHPSELRAGFVF